MGTTSADVCKDYVLRVAALGSESASGRFEFPADCYAVARVGATVRRQQLQGGVAARFRLPRRNDPVLIELLQRTCESSFGLDQLAVMQHEVGSHLATPLHLSLSVTNSSSSSSSGDARSQSTLGSPRLAAVASTFREGVPSDFGLSEFTPRGKAEECLHLALQQCVHEKPRDPYLFLAEHVLGLKNSQTARQKLVNSQAILLDCVDSQRFGTHIMKRSCSRQTMPNRPAFTERPDSQRPTVYSPVRNVEQAVQQPELAHVTFTAKQHYDEQEKDYKQSSSDVPGMKGGDVRNANQVERNGGLQENGDSVTAGAYTPSGAHEHFAEIAVFQVVPCLQSRPSTHEDFEDSLLVSASSQCTLVAEFEQIATDEVLAEEKLRAEHAATLLAARRSGMEVARVLPRELDRVFQQRLDQEGHDASASSVSSTGPIPTGPTAALATSVAAQQSAQTAKQKADDIMQRVEDYTHQHLKVLQLRMAMDSGWDNAEEDARQQAKQEARQKAKEEARQRAEKLAQKKRQSEQNVLQHVNEKAQKDAQRRNVAVMSKLKAKEDEQRLLQDDAARLAAQRAAMEIYQEISHAIDEDAKLSDDVRGLRSLQAEEEQRCIGELLQEEQARIEQERLKVQMLEHSLIVAASAALAPVNSESANLVPVLEVALDAPDDVTKENGKSEKEKDEDGGVENVWELDWSAMANVGVHVDTAETLAEADVLASPVLPQATPDGAEAATNVCGDSQDIRFGDVAEEHCRMSAHLRDEQTKLKKERRKVELLQRSMVLSSSAAQTCGLLHVALDADDEDPSIPLSIKKCRATNTNVEAEEEQNDDVWDVDWSSFGHAAVDSAMSCEERPHKICKTNDEHEHEKYNSATNLGVNGALAFPGDCNEQQSDTDADVMRSPRNLKLRLDLQSIRRSNSTVEQSDKEVSLQGVVTQGEDEQKHQAKALECEVHVLSEKIDLLEAKSAEKDEWQRRAELAEAKLLVAGRLFHTATAECHVTNETSSCVRDVFSNRESAMLLAVGTSTSYDINHFHVADRALHSQLTAAHIELSEMRDHEAAEMNALRASHEQMASALEEALQCSSAKSREAQQTSELLHSEAVRQQIADAKVEETVCELRSAQKARDTLEKEKRALSLEMPTELDAQRARMYAEQHQVPCATNAPCSTSRSAEESMQFHLLKAKLQPGGFVHEALKEGRANVEKNETSLIQCRQQLARLRNTKQHRDWHVVESERMRMIALKERVEAAENEERKMKKQLKRAEKYHGALREGNNRVKECEFLLAELRAELQHSRTAENSIEDARTGEIAELKLHVEELQAQRDAMQAQHGKLLSESKTEEFACAKLSASNARLERIAAEVYQIRHGLEQETARAHAYVVSHAEETVRATVAEAKLLKKEEQIESIVADISNVQHDLNHEREKSIELVAALKQEVRHASRSDKQSAILRDELREAHEAAHLTIEVCTRKHLLADEQLVSARIQVTEAEENHVACSERLIREQNMCAALETEHRFLAEEFHAQASAVEVSSEELLAARRSITSLRGAAECLRTACEELKTAQSRAEKAERENIRLSECFVSIQKSKSDVVSEAKASQATRAEQIRHLRRELDKIAVEDVPGRWRRRLPYRLREPEVHLCACGNRLMWDSVFCQRCGQRRGQQQVVTAASPQLWKHCPSVGSWLLQPLGSQAVAMTRSTACRIETGSESVKDTFEDHHQGATTIVSTGEIADGRSKATSRAHTKDDHEDEKPGSLTVRQSGPVVPTTLFGDWRNRPTMAPWRLPETGTVQWEGVVRAIMAELKAARAFADASSLRRHASPGPSTLDIIEAHDDAECFRLKSSVGTWLARRSHDFNLARGELAATAAAAATLAAAAATVGAETDVATRPSSTEASRCSCGNIYLDDSIFCRICGKERDMLPHHQEFNPLALHFASRDGDSKAVRLLLLAAADPTGTDERGIAPLHLAAEVGHEDVVRQLLAARAFAGAATTGPCEASKGITALHAASCRGHFLIVTILLDAKAPAGAVRGDGVAALHFAAQAGHHDVSRALLSAGAPPEAPTVDGFTPLHDAAHCGWAAVVATLLESRAGPDVVSEGATTPLHSAAQGGHADAVMKLLEFRATPCLGSVGGFTALHDAAYVGSSGVVQLLLRARALIDAQAADGATALHLAAQAGHVDASLLLATAAGPDAGSTERQRVIAMAARLAKKRGHTDVVNALRQLRNSNRSGRGQAQSENGSPWSTSQWSSTKGSETASSPPRSSANQASETSLIQQKSSAIDTHSSKSRSTLRVDDTLTNRSIAGAMLRAQSGSSLRRRTGTERLETGSVGGSRRINLAAGGPRC